MYYSKKLKPDLRITGLIPVIIMIILFSLVSIFTGVKTGFLVVSLGFLIYSVFSLFIFYRTRNISYIAAFLFQIFFALYLLTFPGGFIPIPDKKIASFFQLCYIVAGIWLFYLLFTRRTKWKGREVFELAAYATDLDSNGFTNRPRPAGKAEYTREDLLGFAEYLKKNLIAMPHQEENRIIFIPVKMSDDLRYLLGPGRFQKKSTWIAFDYHGNVTVSMSKRDYLDYKDELSFDQLCENLGKLFIGFMEYYKKGEAERILDKLNELKLSLFS